MDFKWEEAATRAASADELLVLVGCSTVTDAKAQARIQRGDSVPEDQMALRRLEAGERIKTKDLPTFAVASLVANRCVVAVADAKAAHAALVEEYGEWREVTVPGAPEGVKAFAGVAPLPAWVHVSEAAAQEKAAPTKKEQHDG